MQSPSVLRCLIEGLRLLFSPACRFDAAPVGARLRMSDGRDFRIFRRVEIDASLFKAEDKGVVEDLIVAAANDARGKVEQTVQEQMRSITGGLPLPPGFKL